MPELTYSQAGETTHMLFAKGLYYGHKFTSWLREYGSTTRLTPSRKGRSVPKDAEKYGKAESQARFIAALRGGLSTPPTPLKGSKENAENPSRSRRSKSKRGKNK